MSVVVVESARFRFEADMLPALHAASRELTAGLSDAEERVVMFEVPAFESVPDMVVTLLDDDVVERRQAWGGEPVTDPSAVRALVALTAGVGHLDDIALHVGVSRGHLRRSTLSALAEAGWTVPLGPRDAAVELLHAYEPLVQWVVTVEAKRTKWREAVAQARRHLRVADRAYVALDAAHVRGVGRVGPRGHRPCQRRRHVQHGVRCPPAAEGTPSGPGGEGAGR